MDRASGAHHSLRCPEPITARRLQFAQMISTSAGYVTTSTARVPFGDLYFTGTGQWDSFEARPVQGGMFALLLRAAQ
jgi:hypothetical protein